MLLFSFQDLNISTFLWSRCDVNWYDTNTIRPSFCETVYEKDESKTLQVNIETALIQFQIGDTDGAIVSMKWSL